MMYARCRDGETRARCKYSESTRGEVPAHWASPTTGQSSRVPYHHPAFGNGERSTVSSVSHRPVQIRLRGSPSASQTHSIAATHAPIHGSSLVQDQFQIFDGRWADADLVH